MELLEASLALNKATSRQECLAGFLLEANVVLGPKSLQPKGLRLRELLAALLMPVKPARIHRHESVPRLRDAEAHEARNNSHPDLGNSSFWIDSGAEDGMK